MNNHEYLSLLAQGNQAFNNRLFTKAIWYYEKSVGENTILEKHIGFNIVMAQKAIKEISVSPMVELVIPVYNALDDLQKCLASIKSHVDDLEVRVIVVNDGSALPTTEWLREYCTHDFIVYLIENEYNLGYSETVNRGLKLSSAEYVVLLNSDTIVGNNWLKNLKRCIESDQSIGMVGPLSNAATWQSVPYQRGDDGRFFINDIPDSFSVSSFAEWIEVNSLKKYPKVQLLNGFCMMLKREVIDIVGYIDVENFPIGYGEETDYCIRAREAGFELAVADDTFVYHSKSKSFGHEKRSILSQQGETSLKNKYGKEEYNGIKDSMKRNAMLNTVRENILAKLKKGEYVT